MVWFEERRWDELGVLFLVEGGLDWRVDGSGGAQREKRDLSIAEIRWSSVTAVLPVVIVLHARRISMSSATCLVLFRDLVRGFS